MTAAESTRAALLAALRLHEEAAAAIRRELGLANPEPYPAPTLAGDAWLTLKQAEHLAGRSYFTIRRWVIKHGLGRKYGGDWQVSRRLLEAFLQSDGAPLQKLQNAV